MARALECPACGARTALNALPDAPTFRCERCGQVLKVPSAARSTPKPEPKPVPVAPPKEARRQPPPQEQAPPRRPSPAAAAGAAAATAAPSAPSAPSVPAPTAPPGRGGAGAPPPPPRRGGNAATGAAVSSAAAAAAVSATVNPADPSPAEAPSRSRRDRRNADAAPVDNGTAAAPPAKRSEPRRKVRWYWRLLAWVVAVPVGLMVTAWPAYHFKWIKKDDLLDVFVGTGNGRYTRLVVLTLAWALVTALLVQLFVEGGRWVARRRRARKTANGGGRRRTRRPEPQQPQSPPSESARRPTAAARQ